MVHAIATAAELGRLGFSIRLHCARISKRPQRRFYKRIRIRKKMLGRTAFPGSSARSEEQQMLKAAREKLDHRFAKLGLVIQPILELRKKDNILIKNADNLDRASDSLERVLHRLNGSN